MRFCSVRLAIHRDGLERHLQPEQAVLGLRAELGLFANLRPAKTCRLEKCSTLKPEIASRSIC
jgi:3-isopropylmalate dehydrogenase